MLTNVLRALEPAGPDVLGAARAAGALAAESDVAAVLVVAGSASAWLLLGWAQMRAAAPHVSHRRCLFAGAHLVFRPWLPAGAEATSVTAVAAVSKGAKAVGRAVGRAGLRPVPSDLAAAAGWVTLAALVPAAVLAAAYLVIAGHAPAGEPVAAAGLTVGAVAGVAAATWHVRQVPGRRAWLAVRGPHLAVGAVIGEVGLAVSTTALVWSLAHTEGTTVSLLEVGLASVVARAVTLARTPPLGLGLADGLFAVMLVGVGLTAGVTVATVILWRLAQTLAWAAAATSRRALARCISRGAASDAPFGLPDEPTGSAIGEWVHRAGFRAIGALPPQVAGRMRARVFQALFALSSDPWRYDALPYEQRKRQALVASLPDAVAAAGTVVEVGCADGHNLRAIAAHFPGASIVGLDISAVAVAAARQRTSHQGRVRVERSDARTAAQALQRVGVASVDVLVLAEVLYYLGGPGRVRAELEGLRSVLAPGGVLVLVHGASDADRLHASAVDALGCTSLGRREVSDPQRPFVVETALATDQGTVPAKPLTERPLTEGL